MKTPNLDKVLWSLRYIGDAGRESTRAAVDEDMRAACETAWLEGVFYKGQKLTRDDHAANPYAQKDPHP